MSMAPALVKPKKSDTPGRFVVGVGDVIVTDDPETIIITHALGSCIGVTVYDPVACVSGMLHFMLPSSKTNPVKAEANPSMFGDSGIPLLFRSVYELGAKKDRMIVCAAGGAEVMDDDGHFKDIPALTPQGIMFNDALGPVSTLFHELAHAEWDILLE